MYKLKYNYQIIHCNYFHNILVNFVFKIQEVFYFNLNKYKTKLN